MENVVIEIRTEGPVRASEILADLRAAAEALYFPMRVVGFWEHASGLHLCMEAQRGAGCTHGALEVGQGRAQYARSLQREHRAHVEVLFPHAGTSLYLS